ncbi:MAG TPA: DUF4260 domain-containing protein [Terracidiphilus sp.]|nr:DUF4260 domain-containing protein [Terracidiphilus sp.]
MASATATPAAPPTSQSRNSSVILLLRLEGLVVAAATGILFARTGVSWWLFAALWLAPDLSMLGYLAGSCRGARVYNAFHTYIGPGVLALCSLLPEAHIALAVALIWANHIGVDRLLGYGLKYGDGFGFTHLGRMGKRQA